MIKDLVLQEKGGWTGPMNLHVKGLSEGAKVYHDWIEWIVMCNHPFTFVKNKYTRKKNKYTRKNSKLDEISKKTLIEYMVKVKTILGEYIQIILNRLIYYWGMGVFIFIYYSRIARNNITIYYFPPLIQSLLPLSRTVYNKIFKYYSGTV